MPEGNVENVSTENNPKSAGSNKTAGFLFFETADGYKFKSIDALFKQEQKNILQVMMYEDETKCIVVSKLGSVPDLNALCISRSFPEGKTQFTFQLTASDESGLNSLETDQDVNTPNWQVTYTPSGCTAQVEIDTVESASPYIFSHTDASSSNRIRCFFVI